MDISNIEQAFLDGRQIQDLYLDGRLIYKLEEGNLVIVSISGNTYRFDSINPPINGNLRYVDSNGNVLEPFRSNSELSVFNSVGQVYEDENGDISSIEFNAFSDCTNLSSINCPNVQIIYDRAFSYCKNLSSINCPNVTSIGALAFIECSNLLSIDLPNVKTITELAFCKCWNLSSVNCPNVSSICRYAFEYCDSLISIDLPNVNSIEEMTFYRCIDLSYVNCPNVSSIGEKTFQLCRNLDSLVLSSVNQPTTLYDSLVFDGGDKVISVYVRDTEMSSAFSKEPNWFTYYNEGRVKFIPVEKPKVVGTDWTKVDEWLSTLEIGDTSISCPTCSGFMPITLQVVDKDTISCDGYDHTVTFQFNNVLTNKDGSAFKTEFNNYSGSGQPNRYCYSSIKLQVMYNMFAALTSNTNIFIHNDDGSLKTGEDLVQAEAFLNAIQTPTLSVAYYNGTELQGQDTFNDKFWLPSATQVGGDRSEHNYEVEDKCLSYYKDEYGNPIGDFADGKRTRTTVTGSSYLVVQWLRTADNTSGNSNVFGIEEWGRITDGYNASDKYMVCPCLTLAYND